MVHWMWKLGLVPVSSGQVKKTNKQQQQKQQNHPKTIKHTREVTKKWKEVWLYLQKELSSPKNVSWKQLKVFQLVADAQDSPPAVIAGS